MRRSLIAVARTAAAAPVVVIETAVLGSIMILIGLRNPASRLIQRLIVVWSRVFLAVCWCRLHVERRGSVDPSRSYIFVANHESNLDIPVNFLVAHPVAIRYLAKKELYGVPLLGTILRAIGMVETDRQAGSAAHADINRQLGDTVSHGLSLMIYPEGTRSRTAELREFKRGAFRIAVDTQLDLVPVSIAGTYEAFPPDSKLVYGGRLAAIVHEPISVQGLGHDDIADLLERTRETIAKGIAELEAG